MGKHICIQAPPHSGSLYYRFSVVLMALVGADFRFRVFQIREYGSLSNGGIFAGSVLGRGLEARTLSAPKEEAIPGDEHLGSIP